MLIYYKHVVKVPGGRGPFGVGLNSGQWLNQPFRPRLKRPTKSLSATLDWIGLLSLGLTGR